MIGIKLKIIKAPIYVKTPFTVNDLINAHSQNNASYLINAPLTLLRLVLNAPL